MVIRIKAIFSRVIAENQSAFVTECLITDNTLIALETFRTMKK